MNVTAIASAVRTTANPLSIASAMASAIAARFVAPMAAQRARSCRQAAAYRAAVAGDYVQQFLLAGLALNTDRFHDAAARYARMAWREAVAASAE